MKTSLSGVAFAHQRIMEPLRHAAAAFSARYPSVEISWSAHSLQKFEELSLCELSERFDFFAFDHPLLGDVLPHGCVVDLEAARPGIRERLAPLSLGLSLESYEVGASLYGVPFDGAVQSAAWVRNHVRSDSVPASLTDLEAFVKRHGRESVALPLQPAHAGCTFLTIVASVKPLQADEIRFYLDPSRVTRAYEMFCALTTLSSPRSIELDPIHLLEEMSAGDGVLYSPFVFGYGTYASATPGSESLSFGPSLPVSGEVNHALLGGAGIGISAQSTDQSIALDFIEFLMSDEVMIEIVGPHRGQGGLRNGWGGGSDPQMKKFFFEPTREAMETGVVRPRFAGFVNFLYSLGAELTSYARAGKTASEAIALINSLFEKNISEDPLLEALVPSPETTGQFAPTNSSPNQKLPVNKPLAGKPEAAGQK